MSTFPVPFDERWFANEFLELKRKLATLEQLANVVSSGGGAVTSVNGHAGVVVLGASDVGAIATTATAGGDAAGTFSALTVPRSAVFSYGGTLATYTGDYRWYNDAGRTLTFGTIRASAGVAPTGASVIVDVLKGGSTIFTTTGHRPTIAASANTGTNSAAPDVTTIANGDYLTISIIQVGSTVAGADLTVSVVMT